MSDKYKNFQSVYELDAQKEENKKARQLILEQAKKKYEISEAKKERARKLGEGTWMLDSVTQRIDKEEKAVEKEKKKKVKKAKKKKKKRSSSASNDSNASEGEVWTEVSKSNHGPASVKGPQLQRESWMEAPINLIPTTSRQEIRNAILKDKEEARREVEKLTQPGRHVRELNPYWKDGGTGLPDSRQDVKVPSSGTGDGGVAWLRKAYSRCKQQAEDEGRSLEEVAAERWGSLKKLESMLEEAEKKQKDVAQRKDNRDRIEGRKEPRKYEMDRTQEKMGTSRRDDPSEKQNRDSRYSHRDQPRHEDKDNRRSGFRRPGSDSDEDKDNRRSGFRRPGSGSDEDKNNRRPGFRRPGSGSDEDKDNRRTGFRRPGSGSDEDKDNRRTGFRRPGSGSDEDKNNRRPGFRRPASDHNEDKDNRRSGFRRPGSDNEDDKDTRRSGFRRPASDFDKGKADKRSGFRLPAGSDSDEDVKNSHSDHRKRSSPGRNSYRREGFVRPSDAEEDSYRGRGRSGGEGGRGKSGDDTPAWKKKPVVQPVREQPTEEKKKAEKVNIRRKSTSSSASDDSACSASSSESEEEKKHEEPAKILSEEELNELAAKILRAEIMGENDLAAELKEKLENARKQREASKSGGEKQADFCHRRKEQGGERKTRAHKEEGEEDNVVVLSRTSKGGLVRPVAGSGEQWGGPSGKKRKKTVPTHSMTGDRTIYFDNDDQFDLKTLVEREKAGTAEDQNSMFARLAGRSHDKDMDVDDIFLTKAAIKQHAEQAATRDKAAAIFEHKKMSSAMDKCTRCLKKVPKHLIIAIGSKSYLCLPPHRSLTEGHCFVVPIHHVSSATSMDEDVWREMQTFRKSLVQMFTSQGQDVVVMETVMHLKHFPHTAFECIPLDKELGDLAPIYFKKAIQEAGPEWSDNKKLHSLRQKDVRHVIPKGFPYFSVDFGLDGGYATVIEDEAKFTAYFGREIVGGMLDAEPTLWRHPHKQSFEDQRQKVLEFEKMWRPFDWTANLTLGD
ncbi:CWF19-like protein 2 [Physella acuta]|uniref:CWF19-like protein 2 n=1 Tax=Physella acuta TaxID=109671 RepID=UPI0027DCA1F3|nr:CWF19-like protein 2 [Physella acuta]